jgi:carbonic anhydrase
MPYFISDVARHHWEANDMSGKRLTGICLLTFSLICFPVGIHAAPDGCQAAQLPEKAEQHKHHGHHMNIPDEATDNCEPKFTYEEGPQGPSHWEGVCSTGTMQSPIDIQQAQKLSMVPLKLGYQPAALDIVNDCNHQRIVLRLPDNDWLTLGKKPYFLTEIDFHEPGENAFNGKRPRMSIHLIHLSPESVFLIIEIPVVAGKENPAFKTLLEHVPAPGKEIKVEGVKINAMDFLPAGRSYYRFQGSLTTPICIEGVTWLVMKNPIEFSEAQIAEYEKYYRNTARPLQPLNGRPVSESQ